MVLFGNGTKKKMKDISKTRLIELIEKLKKVDYEGKTYKPLQDDFEIRPAKTLTKEEKMKLIDLAIQKTKGNKK